MAVGIRIKLAGVDAEQFDKVEAAINPRADYPDGLIFHASGPIDGGWGVLDFWESRSQFDSFAAGRIGPECKPPESQPSRRFTSSLFTSTCRGRTAHRKAAARFCCLFSPSSSGESSRLRRRSSKADSSPPP